MPIVGSGGGAGGGTGGSGTPGPHSFPVLQIPGLPDFNEEDQNQFVVSDLDGWWNTPPPRTSLSPNGGGAGAVPSGDWLFTEDYQTLSGWVLAAPSEQEQWRQQLLVGIPTNRGVTLTYLGRGWDVDKQVFDIRRYDKPIFEKLLDRVKFTIPIVLPDPLKYSLAPLVGSVGIDVGGTWYESFTLSGAGNYVDIYTRLGAGDYAEEFTLLAPVGAYPSTLTLTSEGSYTSRRVTVDVVGPLTSGDWYLLQNNTRRMWLPYTITAGTTLTIDCYRRRVSLNGVYDRTLTGKLLGVPFSLEPGLNTYKLVTGSPVTTPYATVSAYEAYQ